MASVSDAVGSQNLQPGIRGWLLVLVLWLAVVSPVFWIGFVLVASWWMPPDEIAQMKEMNLDVFLWTVTLVREGLRCAAGLCLYFRRTASSVWLAFAVLWISGPLIILASWLAIEGEYNLPALVRATIVALAWTLYLFWSQRVKITYKFRVAA